VSVIEESPGHKCANHKNLKEQSPS